VTIAVGGKEILFTNEPAIIAAGRTGLLFRRGMIRVQVYSEEVHGKWDDIDENEEELLKWRSEELSSNKSNKFVVSDGTSTSGVVFKKCIGKTEVTIAVGGKEILFTNEPAIIAAGRTGLLFRRGMIRVQVYSEEVHGKWDDINENEEELLKYKKSKFRWKRD